MKTEILAAIGVLASGFAIAQVVTNNDPQAFRPADSTQFASALTQSSFSGQATQEPGSTNLQTQNASSRTVANPPELDFDLSHSSIIQQAAHTLFNSPPLHAKLRYKIQMFGENISGPGRYYQKGQGTRLTRIELDFGFAESAVQLHQFCDGDKLYTLSLAGDQSNLEFVDLQELDRLQTQVDAPSRVANWLSVGSLTGLMEQLSSHFVFSKAQESMLDTIPVVEVVGRWNPAALERLLEGQAEANAIKDGTVNWQRLPVHMPHQVRLTLGRDQRFPYFPYRIVFEQFSLRDGKQVVNEIAVLELYELRVADELTDEMFGLPSTKTEPVDSTEFYRKRILQFTR